MSARFILLALVALAAVSTAYGQAALCKATGAKPAIPGNVRITKNVFDIKAKKAGKRRRRSPSMAHQQ
jgi:hypothetical protein